MRARTSRSACGRKITYDTEDEAQTHLDVLDITQPFDGHHVYLCNRCGKYHIAGGPVHTYRDDGRPRRGRRRRVANE